MVNSSWNKKQDSDNYQRLLDNLIDIKRNDSCLFAKVDNSDFIDLVDFLSKQDRRKISVQPTFAIYLSNDSLQKKKEKIEKALSADEIYELAEEYRTEVEKKFSKALNQDFEEAKKDVVDFFEKEIQKSAIKWKKYIRKANSINAERNIWPVHIGFCYISVKTDTKTIFAPLFFKEVNIELRQSLPILTSNGEIKVNQKLQIFLKSQELNNFELDFDFSQATIAELEEQIKYLWPDYQIPDFDDKIDKSAMNDIRNQKIIFHSGIVLGFFEPSGGYLRRSLENIINYDDPRSIIKIEFNKNVYKRNIEKAIFEDELNAFFKINHTNFSQDWAHVSAILHNTIIWGPPGTGKSQVIANILSNILIINRSALVVSQKKAALEVFKNRLGKLSLLCLFLLNDKNMDKTQFYKPMEELINYLENFQEAHPINSLEIVNQSDKTYLTLLNNIFTSNFEAAIFVYKEIRKSMPEFNEEAVVQLFKLSKDIKLNPRISPTKKSKLVQNIIESQTNKKLTFFQKLTLSKQRVAWHDADIILTHLSKYDGELGNILPHLDRLKPEDIFNIHSFLTFKKEAKQQVNTPEEIFQWQVKKIYNKLNDYIQDNFTTYKKFAKEIRTKTRDPYKFFLKYSEVIKVIYSVIITTPSTDLSMYEKEEFNYAIIDEASQMFLEEALPILYLAQIKVFAGDKEQMQPTRWFASSYGEYIEDEDETLNISSILDHAVSEGVYQNLLDKNYRSQHAALMTFNSKEFYNSQLDIINQFGSKFLNCIEVFNLDGAWINGQNLVEADFVIKKTLENLNKYNKIILLTFNAQQQKTIEDIIFKEYPELDEAITQEKVLVKNLENIQGDEADLLIISVAYDKNTGWHSTYVSKKGGKNALNVATSRAREKIVVVKSVKSEDIQSGAQSEDIAVFKRWLNFLDLTHEEQINYASQEDKKLNFITNSQDKFLDFKQEIIQVISKKIADIQIVNNYSIGTIKFDFALFKKQKMVLGIIVDNLQYYGDILKYSKFFDMVKFIEFKGFPLCVINFLEWKLQPVKVLDKIQELIYAKNNL
ncbi:DEAD/DEAH box helicase [Mesomycoplasma hyorhinis]|uniref:DEAD/DEAH box helicase n=1 Tax=Mesomycoplasma hyorhinis TaxID=2100 RepID=UPI001C058D7E|nr:ATP-binding protein [Mesomycoplasma hyorhinis]